MTVLSVYDPTNPSTSTSEAYSASETFTTNVQSHFPLSCHQIRMLAIQGDFNAPFGSEDFF